MLDRYRSLIFTNTQKEAILKSCTWYVYLLSEKKYIRLILSKIRRMDRRLEIITA